MAMERPLKVAVLVRIGTKFTGMGRYGLELLSNLARYDGEDRFTVYNFARRRIGFGPNFHCKTTPHIPLAGNLSISALGKLSGHGTIGPGLPFYNLIYSTLHEPGGTFPIYWASTRRVWTMHDFVLELHPELTYARNSPVLPLIQRARREAVRAADAVVATSETCKNYASSLLGADRRKVFVVHRVPGREFDSSPKPNVIQQKLGVSEYILILGTVEPRKNHSRVLKAMARMKDRPEKVVIVGGLGWRSEEFMALRAKLGLQEKVLLAGYLSGRDLPAVLSNARAMLQPSLHEGSAPLVLDAMQAGVPMVLSDIPEFREVADGAALFADPFNTEAWSDAMSRVLASAELRADLVDRGKELLTRFTWKESCHALMEVLNKVGRNLS